MTDAWVENGDLKERRLAPLQSGMTIKEVLESAQTLFARMESVGDADGNLSDLGPSPEETHARYVPATWLDALPGDRYETPQHDQDHISAVNSDEAGLYRMFLNMSP